jgi:predicted nucleic acid-binding protein
MSAELFLDTNVLVYAFDVSAPAKQDRALRIVRDGSDGPWGISWHVIQEFSAVALHRFARPMSPPDLQAFQDTLLWPACSALPSPDLHRQALAIHAATRYRFYDCLIVAGAIRSGAKQLYSEDLQHGREIGGVRIVNPFL